MAIFRDDMLQVTSTPSCEYYVPENGYDPEEEDNEAYIDVIKFRAPGHVIAARLDAMGIDSAAVLAQLEAQLNGGDSIFLNAEFRANLDADLLALIDREAGFRQSLCALGAQGWVNQLAEAPADPVDPADRSVGSRTWLVTG